jgi:uncharacterized BrkB/YihY/UPF0761 family membrane protein
MAHALVITNRLLRGIVAFFVAALIVVTLVSLVAVPIAWAYITFRNPALTLLPVLSWAVLRMAAPGAGCAVVLMIVIYRLLSPGSSNGV